MRSDSLAIVRDLVKRLPELGVCQEPIIAACEAMVACARARGTVLVCGNGGSAADAEHLVGELMNRFLLKRPADPAVCARLQSEAGQEGARIAAQLQGAVKAISLVSQSALLSAVSNDFSADMVYAQQVYGYGAAGDILVAISTSGNARNVVYAARVARAMGMHVVGMTGASGGALKALCSTTVCVPADMTYRVQELHEPVYHALCGAVEQELFGA
jgi:D-sedoheptulose 7-phosphate isomerase